MINDLIMEMVKYYSGDSHQIQHFIKVHSYSKLIAIKEDVPPYSMEVLETAAIIHDIGIKPALEKYGSANGKLQEKEGPPVAKEILEKLNFSNKIIERTCYLVANHHTYTNIEGIDYQILVEADFLVNLHENKKDKSLVETIYNDIFKTKTGKELCRQMFLI